MGTGAGLERKQEEAPGQGLTIVPLGLFDGAAHPEAFEQIDDRSS